MQSVMLLCCSIMLLTIVFIFVAVGDKRDTKKIASISTTPEWLENYRLNICCSLSHTGAVTEVDQTFQEIQKLLDIWNDLHGNNPELNSEREEVRRLFEITVQSVEHLCSEFKKGKIQKSELIEELDGQVAHLNDLLRSLANLKVSFV